MLNPNLNSKLKSQSPSNQTLFAMLNVLEGLTYHSVSDTHSLSTEKNSTPKFALRNYPHSPEQIAQEIRVDEEGNLWWKYKNNKYKRRNLNKPIGCLSHGYLILGFNNKLYSAHAIAFALYYGRWPAPGMTLDHINGVLTDNRKENLREVTNAENLRNHVTLGKNNKSATLGVSWDSRRGRWVARVTKDSKCVFNRYFKTIDEAIEARKVAELLFGHSSNYLTKVNNLHNSKLDGISL